MIRWDVHCIHVCGTKREPTKSVGVKLCTLLVSWAVKTLQHPDLIAVGNSTWLDGPLVEACAPRQLLSHPVIARRLICAIHMPAVCYMLFLLLSPKFYELV